MPFEIIKDVKPDLSDAIIRQGESYEVSFDGADIDLSAHHRLYFTCEDRMHYVFKDEPYGDKLYMLIEDSLDQKNAKCDRYCLNLSEKLPRPFPRRAITKMTWGPSIGIYSIGGITNDWSFGICAKAKDLKIEDGGYVRFRFERFDKRPGHPANETGTEPAETVLVDIPEGSYDYTDFSKIITIPDTTACVLLTVEVMGYSGELYFERPHLTASNGDNVCPAFDVVVATRPERYRSHGWVGQSLARKEWPEFRMEINGKVFFEGEKFLRIHRYSPLELEIPDGMLEQNNTLKITYTSDYHDVVPLAIREMKILEKPKAPFHIHYTPENAVQGKDIALLIETESDNMTFEIKSDCLSIKDDAFFPEKGLNVILLTAEKYENNMEFTLMSEGYEVKGNVRKAIERPDDNVVSGSGDLIYIDVSDMREVCDFIEWSSKNSMPGLITIRPAYRWGGFRTINYKLWEKFVDLCNKMGIDYVSISDGRDLPGQDCNPSPKILAGKHYLGVQCHERDGQLFYWGITPNETHPTMEAYFDLLHRMYRESPDTTENTFKGENIVMQRKVLSLRHDICERPDMRDAANQALNSLRIVKSDFITRHTGPTFMSKYFYQAGFDWFGAETMDSPTEPLLASLRGASRAYGKKRAGTHHAVQWSTRPHDTNQRYARYMLTNYVSYMQGMTDINTEEGLWFLECQYTFHNRFSPACVNHAKMQKKLVDFIKSHSRTGSYYTPTAMVHGRFDGWNGFGVHNLFGMPQLVPGDAEEGWALMRIFYPLCDVSKKGNRGVCGYYPEGTKDKLGIVTGTPNGNVDVVPMEKSNFEGYKFVFFGSYNCADERDFDRLYDFIAKGGTVLAAWPHFSTVTYRPDIESRNFDIIWHPITEALCARLPRFENDMCFNLRPEVKPLKKDENGNTLVGEVKIGDGKLIIYNKLFYPGSPEIFEDYKALVTDINREYLDAEHVGIICGEDVEYTMYKQDSGDMHIYLTPTDWQNDHDFERSAKLRVGKEVYDISLPFGEITKIVVSGDTAAWPKDSDFDVLSANPVKVQGEGKTTLYIAKDGKVTKEEIEL
ncbi:MAG: hypothetical protein IJ408_06635 [Clostridia bacterium]|nr:hypothetical protein [Clostridia bacterium]